MSTDFVSIDVLVDPAGSDQVRTAEDAASLVEQLRQLDVEKVETRSTENVPPGTRAVDMVSAGSIIVVAAASRTVLGALLGLVQDWLARRQSGTVSIKIADDELTLTYAPRDAQSKALEGFLSRHTR